jgi:transcription elongation factor GreA
MTTKKDDTTVATDEKETLLTKEGLAKLQEELDYLKNVKRKEVAERLKEAISYGDLSENSEYEDSKNEQAFVEGRIMELEEKMKYAKVITEHKKTKTVQLGSRVIIRNESKKGSDKEEYSIVGSTEADPINHKISNESPIGHALLDHGVGDTVSVSAPAGVFNYKIFKIE